MPFQSFTDKWQDAVMHSSMKNSQLKAFPIPQELFGLNEEDLHGLVDLKPQNGSIFLCHNGHIEVLADENGSLIEYFNAIGTSATGELMRSVFDSDASYIVGTFNDDMTGDVTLTSLGRVRVNVANLLQKHNFLTPTPQYELLWIVDFPMFNLEEDNDNLVISSAHHPFTAPIPEHQHLLYTSDIMDLSKITSRQYDLVMNGWELGGGSIRIHNATLQEHILKNVLKTDSKTFDHLMRGLESGCPPHGGIALGLDRLMAILCDVTSIREVIAFPKSSQGNDLMVGSPNTLTPDYLSQYFIKPN
jgi:aspartyl-tRNA synthetase